MEERWSDVAGWAGYAVSTLGNLRGKRGGLLSLQHDKDGYRCAYIGPRKAGKMVKVHRLVVQAFVGPIPEGYCVNHINGRKDDNRVENLEVVTLAQNTQHGFTSLGRIGKNTNPTKGAEHHNASLNEEAVREIRRLYASGERQVDLAKRFETPQTNISAIVRRKAWAHIAD